jgi:hypothetical protein
MVKSRWLWVVICIILGLGMLLCGLLVPSHLRAVDASVVERAGSKGPALLEEGRTLAGRQKLGTALMLMQAARLAGISGWDRLGDSITNLARQNPPALAWGNDLRAKALFDINAANVEADSGPFTDFIIRQKNRDAALAHLRASSSPAVQELLRTRSLTSTALLPPSSSSAGQAFDAAVSAGGLLLDGGYLSPGLGRDLFALAAQANRGAGSEPMEETLMDIVSLGQRLNWDQLTAFVGQIPDAATLHRLADAARSAGGQLPVLFAAVVVSGRPVAVADYLGKFSSTGLADLGASMCYGTGGLDELLQSGRRFYHSNLLDRLAALNPFRAVVWGAANCVWKTPQLAMALKWLCYLLGGFLLAAAAHWARPRVAPLERPLQVRGFHLVREFLFSLGFLLVVLLLSEPFLTQESQKGGFSLRLHLPMAGGGVPGGLAGIQQTIMNPIILLTLLFFLVLQALLYTASLVKLAEIRRQRVPPRMKLKLLDNEEHLFDAGLYLGFAGTIISFIIASLGLVRFSLMAAYSSTCFGVIFVIVFKIFYLRPARRKLLLEAEADANFPDAQAASAAPAAAPTPAS